MGFCENDWLQKSKKLERPGHQGEIIIPSRLRAVVVIGAACLALLLDIGIAQNSFSSQGKQEIAVPEGRKLKPGRFRRGPDGHILLDARLGQTELRVCGPNSITENCDFQSIALAISAARYGDIIIIEAGIYREAAVLRASAVTIRAEPGAHMRGVAAEDKAALVIKGDDTIIEGLECSGIKVRDRNGACIRLEGKNLTLRNVYFHDSQEGVLGGRGTILIEDSKFERLGAGGQAHGIYVSGDQLIVRRTRVLSSKGEGHEIKSRTAKTIIEESVVASLDGVDSRLIDVSNGGEVIIRNNILEMGPKSANREMIGVGYEGLKFKENSVFIEGNTIIFDRRGGRLIGGTVAPKVTDNVIVGGKRIPGNRWYPDRRAAGLPPYPALHGVTHKP